ncbi:hypothetical protein AHiyo8_19850 [Arthrobacter sp. Hiyo8]|nr:hypothetical protein AHiyo8_19850 [Arthrobacter sp. Hiyo8]
MNWHQIGCVLRGKTKASRAVAAGIIALGLFVAQPTSAFAAHPRWKMLTRSWPRHRRECRSRRTWLTLQITLALLHLGDQPILVKRLTFPAKSNSQLRARPRFSFRRGMIRRSRTGRSLPRSPMGKPRYPGTLRCIQLLVSTEGCMCVPRRVVPMCLLPSAVPRRIGRRPLTTTFRPGLLSRTESLVPRTSTRLKATIWVR